MLLGKNVLLWTLGLGPRAWAQGPKGPGPRARARRIPGVNLANSSANSATFFRYSIFLRNFKVDGQFRRSDGQFRSSDGQF